MRHLALLAVPILGPSLEAQNGFQSTILPEVGDAYRVSVAVGDVDGDGVQDLVIGRNGSFHVRRGLANPPARRFADAVADLPWTVGCTCEHAGQPRLVDFDRDGHLDIVTLDSPFGRGDRVVWFANDGTGRFAAGAPVRIAGGDAFAWSGRLEASAVDVADWDGDGHLDLLVTTTTGLLLHRGGADGFAAAGEALGPSGRAMAVTDWDGDGRPDVLLVSEGTVVAHVRTAAGLAPAVSLGEVEGDAGQTRLAVADWNGDGRRDVLLGENVTLPAAAQDGVDTVETAARLAAAERVLAAVRAEMTALNAERPPLDDRDAMARRAAFREELARWAAGPAALCEQLRAAAGGARPVYAGRVRVLSR